MHVSLRHDIDYNFQTDLINAKNKEEKKNLLPIFIALLGHTLWHPLIFAPRFKPNETPHKVK